MYMDGKPWQKWKRTGNPNTGSEDIQWRYRDENWQRKCTMLIMKSGKRQMMEEIELLYREKIRTFEEKEFYKYYWILEADTIKQTKTKEKIKKEYLRRTRKQLETTLYCRNIIKGINTWAVPLVRYLGLFVKWARKVLQMDQRTRKRKTMYKKRKTWTWLRKERLEHS